MEITPRQANRNFIIYIGVLLLLIGAFLIWFFYFRIDENNLQKLSNNIQNDKEISKYISGIVIEKDDSGKAIKGDNVKIYPYTLGGEFNKSFDNLVDNQKQDVLKQIVNKIEDKNSGGTLVKCGYKKDCSIDNIQIFNSNYNKTDSYTYDINSDETKHLYDDKNGTLQTETLSSTDSSNNNTSTNDSVFDTSEQGTPTETNPGDLNSTANQQTSQEQTTPQIGMTADEVLATSWGKPDQINKTTTVDGVSEQWVYDDANGIPNKYVYLDNGIVTSIQESN